MDLSRMPLSKTLLSKATATIVFRGKELRVRDFRRIQKLVDSVFNPT